MLITGNGDKWPDEAAMGGLLTTSSAAELGEGGGAVRWCGVTVLADEHRERCILLRRVSCC